jgi:hypothetical protein
MGLNAQNSNDRCPVCGGSLVGDGYTLALHCENADLPADREPDAPVYACRSDEEDPAN